MKLFAFILLILGTVGLLLNELVFSWGSAATIILAALNVIGLAILAFTHWVMRD
ncbi:hypothetical protein ACFLV0_07285 [Chloroflexota bacterium]